MPWCCARSERPAVNYVSSGDGVIVPLALLLCGGLPPGEVLAEHSAGDHNRKQPQTTPGLLASPLVLHLVLHCPDLLALLTAWFVGRDPKSAVDTAGGGVAVLLDVT
jgi:hypothetical protein